MQKTVIGLFDDTQHLESAMKELQDIGFDPKEISIAIKDTTTARRVEEDTGADIATGATAGATTGALIGAGVGLLAATAVPGLGAILLGGPIASALGLTGAAAATVSGAATGAVAGGLIGALTNLGLSDEEAEYYQTRVGEGAALIVVPVNRSQDLQVSAVLEFHNAADIKVLGGDITEPVSTDMREGYGGQRLRRKSYAYVGTKGGTSDDEEEDLDEADSNDEDEDITKNKKK